MRVSKEQEERVSKSSWNRNMEERLRTIFSSITRTRDFLFVFSMPPIPIVLKYPFPFHLGWKLLLGENIKYQLIGLDYEVLEVSREEDEKSV